VAFGQIAITDPHRSLVRVVDVKTLKEPAASPSKASPSRSLSSAVRALCTDTMKLSPGTAAQFPADPQNGTEQPLSAYTILDRLNEEV